MISLEKRLTHAYVGTYQHEDKWESIGTIDEIGNRALPLTEEQEGDYCEPRENEIFCLVKLDKDMHARWTKLPASAPEVADFDKWCDLEIKNALQDTYTKAGCHHEYDCCGCRSFYADDVDRVTGDLWRVVVSSSRNF